MIFALAAAILAAVFIFGHRSSLLAKAARAPALSIAVGAGASILYRGSGAPFMPGDWVAAGADAALAALAFAAAAQFRITRLASVCPASFRLTIGGAPLFLLLCGLAAFTLTPQLPLASAFLLAGALVLNGAAFDRRAVADAPAPAMVKAAVRLESAAILALGLPIAVALEAAATAAPEGMPLATPFFEASTAMLTAFAVGGTCGLACAILSKSLKNNKEATSTTIIAGIAATLAAALLGAHPVIAAAAAGLLWGEQSGASATTRARLRRDIEGVVAPLAYAGFGALLAPQILQADLLSLTFALIVVTLLRAGPRYAALRPAALERENRIFLAWFGGAPGAASALYLLSLFDAPSIIAQDAVLSLGALAVVIGVAAARLTSRPLLKLLLKERAVARKRALYAQ